MRNLRALLPLLGLLALLLSPVACKDGERADTSGTSKQMVEYTCKCGKTKTAPVGEAPG